MRTTLTLDDDVAAILERLRKSRDTSLKDLEPISKSPEEDNEAGEFNKA
jgi:hypothetical protein